MNTNELFYFLLDKIKDIPIYRNRAPKNTTTPYLVIKFNSTTDTYPTINQPVTFIIYEKNDKSIRGITELSDELVNQFNNQTFKSDTQAYHFLLSLAQTIPNEMLIGMNAKEIQFNVRVYRREKI